MVIGEIGSRIGITFVLSFLAVAAGRYIALKRALYDVPNARSSHRVPVPRLGGAAFVPVVLVLAWPVSSAVPLGVRIMFLASVAIMYGISLLDDLVAVSAGVRLTCHTMAAAVFIIEALGAEIGANIASREEITIVAGIVMFLWIVGASNIYNFMDGIDGIAGLQGVVGAIAWWFIAHHLKTPGSAALGALVAAGVAGFLTLNWPPAKIFMGDAGSTVLGFVFGVLPLIVFVELRGATSLSILLLSGALIVWPFLADGTFTIFRRLKNRENVFKAHRSHLYQRLVITGHSHARVTIVYGALAALGGFAAWRLVTNAPYAAATALAVPVLGFAGVWVWTIRSEARHRSRSSTRAS